MTRAPHPIRAASPTLRAVFERMDGAGVSLNAMALDIGKHTARVSEYRRGRVEPGIMTVEEMAAALGYELVLRPLSKVAYDTLDKI